MYAGRPHDPPDHARSSSAAAALVLIVVAAVTQTGGDETVDEVLAQTFGEGKSVKSGRLDASLRINAKGIVQNLQGPVALRLYGPVPVDRAPTSCRSSTSRSASTRRPAAARPAPCRPATRASCGSRTRPTRSATSSSSSSRTATPSRPSATRRQGGAASSFRTLGIDPRRWLSDPKNEGTEEVGGDETIHITSGDRRPEVPRGRQPRPRPHRPSRQDPCAKEDADGRSPSRAARQLTDEQRKQIAEAVKDARVDIWTGEDDKILRRINVDLRLDVPEAARPTARAATCSFDLSSAGSTRSRRSRRPTDAKPLDELLERLGGAGPRPRRRGRGARRTARGADARGRRGEQSSEYQQCARRGGQRRQEAPGVRGPRRRVAVAAPTHTALGTWSGGRFMHFGEPLDDERLAALLRPGDDVRTVITADAYGAGEADRAARPRARGRRPRRRTRSSARSATTSTRASARGPRASRASPTRACAAPTSTPTTCAWPPSAASSASALDAFDLLLLHNPDRAGYTSEAVWDGMAALREAGLTAAIGVAPGPANGFTLDLIDCFERFGERIDWAMVILSPMEPWPGELCLDAARAPRRAGHHARRRLRRPVLGRRASPGTRSPSATTGCSGPRAGSRPAARSSTRMRPIAERHGLTPLQLACAWNLAHERGGLRRADADPGARRPPGRGQARRARRRPRALAAQRRRGRRAARASATTRARCCSRARTPDHDGPAARPTAGRSTTSCATVAARWGIDPAVTSRKAA